MRPPLEVPAVMRRALLNGSILLAVCLSAARAADAGRVDEPDPGTAERLFATKVLPLLREKCFACHGDDPADVRGAFDVRSREGMLTGGESGEPAIVPDDPDASPLVQSIEWNGLEMPPKENDRLTAEQIALIRNWIAAGAPWPDKANIERLAAGGDDDWNAADGMPVATSGGLSADWTNRRYDPADLWAYRPVMRPSVPACDGPVRNPIDAFLNAAAAQAGLVPADEADRRTLIRRATFDLTGLPPTPADVAAFVSDTRSGAYERLIDRLLASPHYGEQAARHWLDVTRYADSAGYSNDFARPHAWRYRDYVVRSFNSDTPYDRFVIEQLAGDELAEQAGHSDDPEMLVAVGFLRMGPWEHTGMSVAAVTRQQYLDDVTNAVGETFLATPMSCCRCHDHKFDPIPTRDYYRMQAVFAPVQFADRNAAFLSEENRTGIDPGRQRIESLLQDEEALQLLHDAATTEQQRAEAELALKKLRRKRTESFERELQQFKPLAMSVYNGPPIEVRSNRPYHPLPGPKKRSGAPQEVFILADGALESPGERVEPGVLSVVAGLAAAKLGHRNEAGALEYVNATPGEAGVGNDNSMVPGSLAGRRLAFAEWVASPDNPLTARVMVNRVWQQHFGTGLAANPNNFGKMGRKPTHPELLDWLADEFVRQGWSIKSLHRLIMTSAAYRRCGSPPDPAAADRLDSENRLLTWYPPRRLSAEEIRDAMLAVSGELNSALGGLPARPEINREIAFQPRHVMGSVTPAYQPSKLPGERNRRTLYALRIRTLRDPLLEVFDQPSPDLSCERRSQSTIAPQAFSLFNGQSSHDRALALALHLENEATTQKGQITLAFRLAYGRSPTAREVDAALRHATEMTEHHRNRPAAVEPLPVRIERSMVEEQTGTEIRWSERLDVYEDYIPDAKPWEVGPATWALADFCLVLLNSNEFLYVY